MITINSKTPETIFIGNKEVQSISILNDIVWSKGIAHEYFYFEDRSGATNIISCTKTGSETEWLSLEFSTDKSIWFTYDLNNGLTIPANGRIYLRGSNTYGFGKDNANYHTFTCSGNYALGGDLYSIMDDSIDLYNSRFGSRTFNGSTTLVDISQLVFGNKQILGTTFTWMFQNCTALASVPREIGLSYSPNIDFTIHTSHFTQMFQSSPIANFPKFPNITAISKNGMNRIAQANVGTPNTNLTYVDLSNITTLYEAALYQAFHHTRNLEVVKIDISAWPDFVDSTASDYNATYQWLNDVHSTGVFCKNDLLLVQRGVNQIPQNWSIADLDGKLYTPVITNNNNTITITEAEGGASCQIYYTTDGTTPTPTNGTLYTQPFSVVAGTVVKAISHYAGTRSDLITDSDIAEIGAEYQNQYFTIKNTGSNSAYVQVYADIGGYTETIQFSRDNGTTWDSYNIIPNSYTPSIILTTDQQIYIKHTGSMNGKHFKLGSTNGTSIQLCGNIASLCFGDNFTGTKTMHDNAFNGLFGTSSDIINIKGIYAGKTYFTSFDSISQGGIQRMFYQCTALKFAPNLSNITSVGYEGMRETFLGCYGLDSKSVPNLSNITSVGESGMRNTFNGCKLLSTSPNLSSVETVGDYGMLGMFGSCYKLIETPDLTGITSVGAGGMSGMFNSCKRLTEAYAPTITWDTSKMSNWLNGVAASGTVYADPSISSSIPLNSTSGCPTGWTVEATYDCSNCDNWQECGYESYADCDCQVNGNCPEEEEEPEEEPEE